MLEDADSRICRVAGVPGNLSVRYKNAVSRYGSVAETIASNDRRTIAADRLANRALSKGDMRAYAKACAARIQHRYAAFCEAVDWSCKSKTEGEKFIERIT